MSSTPTAAPGGEIHRRLAAVLREADAIGKDRVNEQERWKFRSIDDVYNMLHGLFAKHEVYLSMDVVSHQQTERPSKAGGMQLHTVVVVRYTFTASDGSRESMVAVGEAADDGDKSLGKALQYALKVLLLQAFLIPTDDGLGDPDAQNTEWAAAPRGASPAQRPRGRGPAKIRPPAEPDVPHDAFAAAAAAIRKATSRERVSQLIGAAYQRPALAERMAELEAIAAEQLARLTVAEPGA